jgi:hypothetical protein
MTEHEAETYFRWLSTPDEILDLLTSRFSVERLQARWGKLYFLGQVKD